MELTNPLLDFERQLVGQKQCHYFGTFPQQNPLAFVSLNRLITAYGFDRIVEIGTHDGGLSVHLALYCYLARSPAECDNPAEPSLGKNLTRHKGPKAFYTFDIVERDKAATRAIQHLGGHFIKADTLTDAGTIEYIRSLIRGPGRTLLICDGGSKKRELELYAPSLKPGDFVMAHDWARDEAAFEALKVAGIWHGWETRWEDGEGEGQQFGIKAACEAAGVIQVYPEEFDKVAWFCGVKP